MKRLFLWLIVLPLCLVLLTKGYIYYKVTEELDDLVTLASPVARITYKDVTSTFTGEIIVGGVKLRPNAIDYRIAADQITLRFPSFLEMVLFRNPLEQQRLPASMQISVDGVQVQLEDIKALLLPTSEGKSEGGDKERKQSFTLATTALGCPKLETDSYTLLQRLGYNQIDLSLKAAYYRDSRANTLRVDADLFLEEMSRAKISTRFGQVGVLSAAALTQDNLDALSLEFEDLGYNGRFTRYCAQQQGIEVDEFMALHLRLVETALEEQEVIVSDALFSVYEYYLHSSGVVRVAMNTERLDSLADLALYNPADLQQLLELEVSLGGLVLQDLQMNWDQQKLAEAVAVPETVEAAPARQELETPAVVEEERRATYVETAVPALADFLYKEAIIVTRDGRELRGTLSQVNETQVFIDVVIAGGRASLPLKKEAIVSAKILR